MSLSAKRESLARIHGRYQRAGRPHKQRILDEFCATCGYHRKSALRLLHRPLALPGSRARPGPQRTYDPAVLLPVLKVIWLASEQLCSKLLKAALPEWLDCYERQHAPLADAVKEKLRAISPAQIDRLLRPARVGQTKKGLSTTRPGTLLRHQVPPQRWPQQCRCPWVSRGCSGRSGKLKARVLSLSSIIGFPFVHQLPSRTFRTSRSTARSGIFFSLRISWAKSCGRLRMIYCKSPDTLPAMASRTSGSSPNSNARARVGSSEGRGSSPRSILLR